MNISIRMKDSFGAFCDRGIVFSLCVLIFVLPVSIALLDSFAGLAIFFYALKKIDQMITAWPLKASCLNFAGRIHFVWKGFAPVVNPLNLPLQFLALAVFISVLFSQYPGLSFAAFIGKFLKSVFLYFSFIEAFKDERRVRIFLGFFLASAFIVVLNGILQHYAGKDLFKGHFMGGGRENSTFKTANGLGAYLLPVIGMVIYLLHYAIMRMKAWILGGGLFVFLAVLLVSLCWSYSRSSWLGFIAMLIVMVLLDLRKVFFITVLIIIFIFLFLPSLNNVRHLHLFNDSDVSGVNSECSFQKVESAFGQGPVNGVKFILKQGGSGRFMFWKKAFSIIRISPVYGTGLNTYLRIIKRDPDQGKWWYAHNCYLQLTAETGLLGLGCFLWMLFVLLRYSLNYCKQINDPWLMTLLQGTISGLIGFLIQSCLDNTFYTVQLGVLMWLIFGLMVALTRLNPFVATGER